MLIRSTGLVLVATLLLGVFRAEIANVKPAAPVNASDQARAEARAPDEASEASDAPLAEESEDGALASANGPIAIEYHCCCGSSGVCGMITSPCPQGSTEVNCPCQSGVCGKIDPEP